MPPAPLPACSNIGDGGNKEGPDKKWYQQPPYSAYREPSFGHGTLDLADATHAGAALAVHAAVHAAPGHALRPAHCCL